MMDRCGVPRVWLHSTYYVTMVTCKKLLVVDDTVEDDEAVARG